MMKHRKAIEGLRALLVLSVLTSAVPATAGTRDAAASLSGPAPTVVELFTSQGCSSCPPADEVLGALSERSDVVALSFHVNYWDRLGWPDPHATQWGTDRQRSYAGRLDLSYVYTPQMVIDGNTDVVGSRYGEIQEIVANSQSHAGARVPVGLSRDGDTLNLALVDAPGIRSGAHLYLLSLIPRSDNAVSRGENAGRHLEHVNVVRSMRDLGPWDGRPGTRDVALAGLERDPGGRLAVLVQTREPTGAPGPILGAGILN